MIFFLVVWFWLMTTKHVPERSRLLERTLELLRDRPRTITLAIIEENTGLKQTWLQSLSNGGKVKSPNVCSIVKLYEYLSESKLQIN